MVYITAVQVSITYNLTLVDLIVWHSHTMWCARVGLRYNKQECLISYNRQKVSRSMTQSSVWGTS